MFEFGHRFERQRREFIEPQLQSPKLLHILEIDDFNHLIRGSEVRNISCIYLHLGTNRFSLDNTLCGSQIYQLTFTVAEVDFNLLGSCHIHTHCYACFTQFHRYGSVGRNRFVGLFRLVFEATQAIVRCRYPRINHNKVGIEAKAPSTCFLFVARSTRPISSAKILIHHRTVVGIITISGSGEITYHVCRVARIPIFLLCEVFDIYRQTLGTQKAASYLQALNLGLVGIVVGKYSLPSEGRQVSVVSSLESQSITNVLTRTVIMCIKGHSFPENSYCLVSRLIDFPTQVGIRTLSSLVERIQTRDYYQLLFRRDMIALRE